MSMMVLYFDSSIGLYLIVIIETTVITLMDWYHSVAPSLFPNPTNATPYVYFLK